jgi:2-methylcitrate dehydratase PrpD
MTLCEEVGRWVAALRLEDVPATVQERAKLQTASIAAARAAGARAAAPFAAVAPDGPAGEVYRSAAASIAHDWDDYLFMGHSGHSAVPAAAAFAEDPERALLAQVAANEVAGRLGAALFIGPHNGQFWASIHCAGAAVASSAGIGLGAEQTAHALAIALYQPPYGMWPGFMGPDSKLLTAAEPAAAGVRAALLAADGVSGALDVLEHPRGVLANLSFVPRPSMLGGLGRVWLTETLAFKRLPGCAYLQAAVEAALSSEVDPGDVAEIEVEAGWLTCEMEELGHGAELTPVRVNFSAALSIAVALLAGRLTHEELHPAWLKEHEAEVRGLGRRVKLRHAPELTAATLRGTLEAGAGAADLSLRDWLRVRRRIAESGMEGANPAPALLRAIAADRGLRRAVLGAFRSRGSRGQGIEGLDTSGLRMTFPCRLRTRLRSGAVREVEGDEPGSCGRLLAEQRAVVDEKCRLVGLPAPVASG